MSGAVLTLNAFSIEVERLFGGNNQDKRFLQILLTLLFLYGVFGLVVPLIERVEVPREVKEQVPAQLTRILLKEKEIPPSLPPEVVDDIKPEEIEKAPKEPPKTKREVAKQKANTAGLAAMKDDLFSLRDAFKVKPTSGELIKEKANEATTVKRKLITAKATEQSQNIAAAKVGKTVKSDELSTRNTQTLRLAEEEILADSLGESEAEESLANVRSEMKLRQTLEANKSRLYSSYNRALRKDPFLKGKVLFEIEIQPDGSVSKVFIQSSELDDKKLERRLMLLLKSIDFGAEDVSVISTVWAIEFLPR